MASPQCSVRAAAPAVSPPLSVRSAFERPTAPRSAVPAGRAARPIAPATDRRDPVRPGARPARLEGVAVLRPAGGDCCTPGDRRAARGRLDADGVLPPLRLTLRGRRVVAGLSVAIGLSIAAVTATVVQVSGGGLQLAGVSTVVVQPGDTLWSIALDAAPDEDPRAVVEEIVDLNDLEGVGVAPGQVLELP
jgi:nucleoid-associated protein YgaU